MKPTTVGVAFALVLAPTLASADETPSSYPASYAERPLTLPRLMLSPELSLGLSHFEITTALGSAAANAVGINVGASLGITDDLTVYLVPLTMLIATYTTAAPTKVYYGTFRAGAMYRFVHTDKVDFGGQFELAASGAAEAVYTTFKLPLLLRLAPVLRIDTGLAFTVGIPTDGRSVDAGFATVSNGGAAIVGLGSSAGIPIAVTVQPEEHIFFGLDTGLGIGSFRGTVSNSVFMPLGAFVGGTIVGGNHAPLVDIVGSFGFPFFLLGADNSPPTTQLWQVGLGVRAYLPLQ